VNPAHDRLIVACIGISKLTSPERAENRNVRGICQQPIFAKFFWPARAVYNARSAFISSANRSRRIIATLSSEYGFFCPGTCASESLLL